jgi:hypothetical protein
MLGGSELGGKYFADDESWNGSAEVAETQSKDFYAAGFDAVVKRWD